MPHKAMSDHEHLSLHAEVDIAIRRIEVVTVGAWMDGLPLEKILRADGVELRSNDWVAATVSFLELRRIEGCSDEEDALMRFLQLWCSLVLRHCSQNNEKRR